jgi:uncharacterized protein (TIGR03083 family)
VSGPAVAPTLEALFHTWDSVDALLADRPEPDWKTPTRCPGWSVQDVLSHMVATERLLAGLPLTTHTAEPAPHVRNPIGRFNENEVDARRGLPGAAVLAEWHEVSALRREALRTADDEYFTTETDTPTGRAPRIEFIHLRVLDCWVHEQDARAAIGPEGNRTGPGLLVTVERLARSLPMVVGKRAAARDGDCVTVRLTGGVEREWHVAVSGGRAALAGPTPAPTATLTMDAWDYAWLATGRADEGAAGRVRVEGDAALAQRLVAGLNVMI